jgi:hypothetical protein
LIDISGSQGRLIDIERDAASAFFPAVIRPKDEAFLISFGKSTDLLQDFTSSPRLLTAGLSTRCIWLQPKNCEARWAERRWC